MLRKEVKTPMIIGLILYAVAFLTTVIITLGQNVFIKPFVPHNFESGETVISPTLFSQLIMLLMMVIFFLIMKTYKGNSRRVVGGVMLAVYLVVSFIMGFVGLIGNVIYSRMGQEYIVKLSSINQVIGFSSSLIMGVALIFVVVAIGRFGISDPVSDERIGG